MRCFCSAREMFTHKKDSCCIWFLDDLMAWIILQVRWENAKAGSTTRTSSPCPASSPSLIAKGRSETVLPPLPFCGVQRKRLSMWRRPRALGGYCAGGNAAGRGAAASLLVSLSTKAQSNSGCRAGCVKLSISPGFLPLFKNLIFTFNISPSSSLPVIKFQTFTQGWGASHGLCNHGPVNLWL